MRRPESYSIEQIGLAVETVWGAVLIQAMEHQRRLTGQTRLIRIRGTLRGSLECGEEFMRANNRRILGTILFASLLLSVIPANAQLKQNRSRPNSLANSGYNLASETVLEGTVLKYTEHSSIPPLGAHLTLQTASGPVDVHIGDANFLKLHNFSISEGASVRIVGQSRPFAKGTMFFARILQNGNQTLAVRSTSGMPLWRAGARTQLPDAQSLQAQRGAR